jgi:hypothetical protein
MIAAYHQAVNEAHGRHANLGVRGDLTVPRALCYDDRVMGR